MAKDEKNKKILVMFIICLLFFVLGFTGYSISFSKKNNTGTINLKINQLYSSDYELNCLDNKYFIGSYDTNRIDVIIDGEGNEIYKSTDNIYYDGIYKLKDERYLIYDNNDGALITYIFDGNSIDKFYEIRDVDYVKPIIYSNLEKVFILGFAGMIENNLYLYVLENGGIIVVPDVSIVSDNNTSDAYYTYNEKYLVVKNSDDLMGVITLDGQVVVDYEYKDIINNNEDTFIVLNKDNKYGIIDDEKNVLVKFNYKVIDKFDEYYLFVNTNNKMALYDSLYKRITKYEMDYNTLIEYSLRNEYNSIHLYKVNGKIAVVNNYLEDTNGTEYDKHNLYIIDGNKITRKITQVGFGYDQIVYTYDNKFNINIYNSDMSLLFNIKINDIAKINEISYINNHLIKIKYEDIEGNKYNTYYDLNGKKQEFKLGELYLKDIEYRGYTKKSKGITTLTLYDLDNNELASIYGKKISNYDKYLIVDNSIYRIEVKETS